MNESPDEMIGVLLRLRTDLRADLAGFSVADGAGGLYRWSYESGSVSGRCQAMTFRKGRGVGGQILRIGTMVIWNAGAVETERLKRECPLMQAEALCTVIAAPVKVNGEVRGVLAVGSRTERAFVQRDADLLEQAAEKLTHVPIR